MESYRKSIGRGEKFTNEPIELLGSQWRIEGRGEN